MIESNRMSVYFSSRIPLVQYSFFFPLHRSFLKVQGRFMAIFEETIFALQKEIIAGNNKLKWKVEIRLSFLPYLNCS